MERSLAEKKLRKPQGNGDVDVWQHYGNFRLRLKLEGTGQASQGLSLRSLCISVSVLNRLHRLNPNLEHQKTTNADNVES